MQYSPVWMQSLHTPIYSVYRLNVLTILFLNFPAANITLQQSDHTVGEGDGSVTVCAELTTGNLERNVTVYLTTADGTATGEYICYTCGSCSLVPTIYIIINQLSALEVTFMP